MIAHLKFICLEHLKAREYYSLSLEAIERQVSIETLKSGEGKGGGGKGTGKLSYKNDGLFFGLNPVVLCRVKGV